MPIILGLDPTASDSTLDVLQDARRYLYGRDRQALNRLAGAVTNSATTVQFTYQLDGIQAGATISVGLEEMHVWSVDDSAKTALVQRAMNGSTATAHSADDIVYVNPRFSDFEIFQELNNTLRDLSSPYSGLFQVKTLDLTSVSGQEGYDLDVPGFLDVAEIRWQDYSTVADDWPELTDWQISDDLPTSTFPSGRAIFLTGGVPAGRTVRVRYKAEFDLLTGLTDTVVTATGLPGTALDVLAMGAAIRVMDGRAIGRADYDRQGDGRRADEVRVGDVTQAPAALRARYAQRVSAEAARLTQQWPQRLRARIRL